MCVAMIPVASLAQQIENALRDDILARELVPGQRISIGSLATRWGISVTSARDAVMRLESIGLVRARFRNFFRRTLNAFDGHGVKAPEAGGHGRRSAA